MREGTPYRTAGFLVFGNNSLSTYADARLVKESLAKLDFMMVADLFMTPTCELADVVLPVAAWPELEQIVAMPYFGEDVVLAQQPGERVGQCRADEDIMTDLARRLGLPHSEESPRDVFNQQLAPLGITYEERGRFRGQYVLRRAQPQQLPFGSVDDMDCLDHRLRIGAGHA